MDAYHLHAIVHDGRFTYSANRRIDAGTISARRKNTDFHKIYSLTNYFVQRYVFWKRYETEITKNSKATLM